MGAVINYLIVIAGIAIVIPRLKAKGTADPQFRPGGLSAKSLVNLGYAGIAIFVVLIVVELAKN